MFVELFCSPLGNEFQSRAFVLSTESVLDIDFHANLDTFMQGLAPNITETPQANLFNFNLSYQTLSKPSANYGPVLLQDLETCGFLLENEGKNLNIFRNRNLKICNWTNILQTG